MKNTKTIFFGAMAAIMMSAGAHAADTNATVQIASKKYVDTEVGKIDTKVTTVKSNIGDMSAITVKVGNAAVDTIVGAVNQLKTEIDNIDIPTLPENLVNTDGQDGFKNYKKSSAIPQPATECANSTSLCVLSVDGDGNLRWVNVTDPVGDLPAVSSGGQGGTGNTGNTGETGGTGGTDETTTDGTGEYN